MVRAASRSFRLLSIVAVGLLSSSSFVFGQPVVDEDDPNIPTNNPVVLQGPSPATGGQAEGITNNPVSGAINTLAPHPSNANIMYAGSVNGGIWRTTNAQSNPPTWTRLTSNQLSQSIGIVAFDPTDATGNTLAAGIGRFSSFGRRGGSRSGVYKTTDGVTFSDIDGTQMDGRNIVGIAPRGDTIVAAVDIADSFTCPNIGIWRTTDNGTSWSQITNGIPRGTADALASDPSSTSTLYASIVFAQACDGASNGIYKSTDTGASWSKVSDATMDALLIENGGVNVDIAVGTGSVFVAIVPGNGLLGGVFQSTNGGTSWTSMDLPGTIENPGSGFVGVHAGGQGSIHSSLAVDPTDADIVYVGGDRQPRGFQDQGSFPNSLGAVNFSGRLFRGDAGLASGSQWTSLTHSGTASNSSPHADSRVLVFDSTGRLWEGDDGGIYERTSPRTTTGDWIDKNGDIQVTEQHNTGYDALNDILINGNQDTGSSNQTAANGITWAQITQGDGGDSVAGPHTIANQSVRISSFQNFGNPFRRTFDSSNSQQTGTFLTPLTISGPTFAPQFTTPVGLNRAAANRVVVGGGNGVYESLDQLNTLSQIGAGIVALGSTGGGSIEAGHASNADLLYVTGCSGSSCFDTVGGVDGVWVRTTNGGALAHVLGDSSTIFVGVTVDPDDVTHAFAVDDAGNIYETTNTGSTWSSVTGNFASLNMGVPRSIEFVNSSKGDGVFVGADRGIALALASASFSTWTEYSAGLPNSPVYEMIYDQPSDTLVVGTLGSGSFKVDAISTGVQGELFADGFESGNTSVWSLTVE